MALIAAVVLIVAFVPVQEESLHMWANGTWVIPAEQLEDYEQRMAQVEDDTLELAEVPAQVPQQGEQLRRQEFGELRRLLSQLQP